jgi:hypothetical protein
MMANRAVIRKGKRAVRSGSLIIFNEIRVYFDLIDGFPFMSKTARSCQRNTRSRRSPQQGRLLLQRQHHRARNWIGDAEAAAEVFQRVTQ